MSCKNKQSARLLQKVLTVSILYPGWNRMGLSLIAPRIPSLQGEELCSSSLCRRSPIVEQLREQTFSFPVDFRCSHLQNEPVVLLERDRAGGNVCRGSEREKDYEIEKERWRAPKRVMRRGAAERAEWALHGHAKCQRWRKNLLLSLQLAFLSTVV